MGWSIGWDTHAVAAIITPAMPASGTPITNTTGSDVMVYITAGVGAITGITVNGVAITNLTVGAGLLGHPVRLSAGASISLTYTGSPSWQWIA